MKAITIWQPWASLIAIGEKRYETRGWATTHRGPIAIHAAARKVDTKGLSGAVVNIMVQAVRPITEKLATTSMYLPLELLPRGCIIATAELVECHRVDAAFMATLSGQEASLGDYTSGQRYAWEMANVNLLSEPLHVKGKQGLWNFDERGLIIH